MFSEAFVCPHGGGGYLCRGGLCHGDPNKECRSIVRDESSAYFNVTAVNRYDL